MSDLLEEEQCIAITQAGDRCSRVATGDRFCFQHDESFPTIDGTDSNPEGFSVIVSDQLSTAPEKLSGVQQDLAQNLNDIISRAGGIGKALRSADFGDAADSFRSTATATGPTAGTGALIGGAMGSPFGPIGIAAGATAGGWYGVYHSTKDGRAVAATIVDDEEIPDNATVNSSDHPAIADLEPVQLAMASAIETDTGRSEWLRSTLTRERDMGAVAEAFEKIEAYASTEEGRSYFINHEEREVVLKVIFGEPQDDDLTGNRQ